MKLLIQDRLNGCVPYCQKSFSVILLAALIAPITTLYAADPKTVAGTKPDTRPNILFLFADDWGRYAGCYAGLDNRPTISDVVRTPHIDRIAGNGVVFRNAFVNAPSCTPCRSALLSGQYFFRTGSASILLGARWDSRIPAYPLLLRKAGYHIGKMYKVWSPGEPTDAPYGYQEHAYEKAGQDMARFSIRATAYVKKGMTVAAAKEKIFDQVRSNFKSFLAAREPEQPFCFWYGPWNTHRAFEKGSGKALWGIDPESVKGKLPKFMPDVPEVRIDYSDYMGEIEAWDTSIGVIIDELKKSGLLENTLIVISGDHGMPGVPGGKCNLYDHGTAVALVAAGPGIKGGRIVEDFVNMMDIAPTFLDAGGVDIPEVMTGRSIMPVLHSDKDGQVDPVRTFVVTGRERHDNRARPGNLPYPMRALRTKDFLYIRNFAPDRWPAGAPMFTSRKNIPSKANLLSGRPTFKDMDGSPTKAWLVHQFDVKDWAWHYNYAFGKRLGEELYDLKSDPDQTRNLAADPAYAETKEKLAAQLMQVLTEAGDPRVVCNPVPFDRPPFAPEYKPNIQGRQR